MRFASYTHNGESRWGIIDGDDILLAPRRGGYPDTLLALLQQGDDWRATAELVREHGERLPVEPSNLLAPLPRPAKNVMCLGLNYAAHAAESLAAKGKELSLPEHPVVFTKAVTSVTGPYADVPLDPAVTEQLDWETELAVVIGRGGRHIDEARALEHVFGYTVLNDLSARDLQFRHKQFFVGKSMDGGCPMGPWLITADEVSDPQALDISCRVNGELKQHANTAQQIFTVAHTIAVLSRSMTLEPGDIISTGTPDGVGFARKPPEFLHAGDLVECEVEGIGRIANRIVAAPGH